MNFFYIAYEKVRFSICGLAYEIKGGVTTNHQKERHGNETKTALRKLLLDVDVHRCFTK